MRLVNILITSRYYRNENLNMVMSQAETKEELKKSYILDIINKAIEKLNKIKGLKLKLIDVKFEQAIEAFKKPAMPCLMVTIVIQNAKTKCSNSFLYLEDFFDASVTNKIDKAAGIENIGDSQNKVILRLAYDLWEYCKPIDFQTRKYASFYSCFQQRT